MISFHDFVLVFSVALGYGLSFCPISHMCAHVHMNFFYGLIYIYSYCHMCPTVIYISVLH
uniref:Uncharacterized protein n=1 Tax=Rhizophora mucronata TaxID=61149 RepID=A0A2P2QY43_RHIMU